MKSTSDGRLPQRAKAQVTLRPAVEEAELLQKLYHLLEAKGFQTRMEGVALLLDLCKSSPQLISTNIVQVRRVSSWLLSFSSFPKPVAVKLIWCVLALHPACLGHAAPSYADKFNSGPGFRTSYFSTAVFVWQVPIDALHQMITEFSAAVTSAVSSSQLGQVKGIQSLKAWQLFSRLKMSLHGETKASGWVGFNSVFLKDTSVNSILCCTSTALATPFHPPPYSSW